MGSVGSQNPWAPYDSSRECTPGVCSIYCPQFCYLIFPPPPPLDDSGTQFSPLIIAVIGVLASAFLLVGYYTLVTRLCRRRNDQVSGVDHETPHVGSSGQDQWPVGSTGLDESIIKRITVCKYEKGNGLIEDTDCAVCLSEFQENESLRLLPNCSHAFHLPCIDIWLKSHSNCPLCRANVADFTNPNPSHVSIPQSSSSLNAIPYEFHRPNNVIFIVDDQETGCQDGVVITIEDHGNGTRENDENAVEFMSSSVSAFALSPPKRLLISDILKCEEMNDYMEAEYDHHFWWGIGPSKGFPSNENGDFSLRKEFMNSPVATKMGDYVVRFMDKGKNSMFPS